MNVLHVAVPVSDDAELTDELIETAAALAAAEVRARLRARRDETKEK